MTPADRLKRRIELKRQALPLIKEEIIDDQLKLALFVMQARYEKQMKDSFDPELSLKIAALAVTKYPWCILPKKKSPKLLVEHYKRSEMTVSVAVVSPYRKVGRSVRKLLSGVYDFMEAGKVKTKPLEAA